MNKHLSRWVTGYRRGEEGFAEVKGVCHNYWTHEFFSNAPIIWPIGRVATFLSFTLPLICLYSLLAKLSGKKVVKKGEYWGWE